MREYLEKVRPEWAEENRDQQALWLSAIEPHDPLKKQMVAVIARDYGWAAGLKKSVSPHIWRHTCATHMVSNGSNIACVQQLLGHRSLETTQRYTRVAIPEVRATFQKKHPRSQQNGASSPQTVTSTQAKQMPLRGANYQ